MWLRKLRFYAASCLLYGLVIFVGWTLTRPMPTLQFHTVASKQPALHPITMPIKPVLIGQPVRIVIPDSGVDLPIESGYYDAATDSWTLDKNVAYFAVISSPANDQAGETFVYGHNNNDVFGALRHQTPTAGTEVLIHTDNGHIFSYRFTDSSSVGPNDVSVLNYQGPPRLTIQTCTGSFDELRTMYRFAFDRVVQ